MNLGEMHMRVLRKVGGKLFEVTLFRREIEFVQEGAAKLAKCCRRLIGMQVRDVILCQLGEHSHDVEIAKNLLFDAGMLHLDDDLLAAEEPSAMNLANRRRGKRLVVELGKQLIDGASQLRANRLLHGVGGIGRRVRSELAQLGSKIGSDQVGSRTEHLAKLDEGRAKLRQSQADACRLGELAESFPVEAEQASLDPFVIESAEPVGDAVSSEDREDFANTFCVTVQACKHRAAPRVRVLAMGYGDEPEFIIRDQDLGPCRS